MRSYSREPFPGKAQVRFRNFVRACLLTAIQTGVLFFSAQTVFAQELLRSEPSTSISPTHDIRIIEPGTRPSSTPTPAGASISQPPLVSFPSQTVPQAIFVKITGTLFERGTKNPLPRVNIYCFSSSQPEKPVKTTTDKAGKFFLEVPEGGLKWVFSVSGYRRLEVEDEQLAGRDNKPRTFYLEKNSYLTYETTV